MRGAAGADGVGSRDHRAAAVISRGVVGVVGLVVGLAAATACADDPPGAPRAAPEVDATPVAAEAAVAGDATPLKAGKRSKASAAGPFALAECPDWSTFDLASAAALPDSPHRESFEVVWRTLLEKHHDPTLACLDWPAVRLAYGARVAAASDHASAYAVINEMLGLLGQSHLYATPPDAPRERVYVPQRSGRPPIAIRSIDGEMLVVDAAVDGVRSEVPVGSRLITVRGQSVEALVAAARARAADGGAHLSSGAAALAAVEAVESELACSFDERVRITYEPGAGGEKVRTASLPCDSPQGERVSLGNLTDLVTRVRWRRIAGTRVGYIAFNYWMVPMIDRVAEGIAELRAEGIDALVVDLRGNPGGVGAMAIPVGRMLLPEGGHLGRLRMRAMTQELKVAPPAAGVAFAGPVAILVDGGTASTSEIFAVGMRDLGRAVVVGGEASAGMALPSLIETLPDGGRLQYVVGDYESPLGSVAEGSGVPLDLRVDEDRAAIAGGRDPVLDGAVELLQRRVGARDAEAEGGGMESVAGGSLGGTLTP